MRPTRRERTTLSSEELLAALPRDSAAALVAVLEGEPFEVRATWRGGNARTYLLRLGGPDRRLVLKHIVGRSHIEYEADILRRAAVLPAGEARLFPRLHAVLGTDSLLMEYVPGRTVRAAVQRDRELDPVAIAEELRSALECYHRSFGAAFHDFHPENVVLRAGGGVTLIDPAPPGAYGSRPGDDPWTTDVALWTYATIIGLPWAMVSSPAGAWRMVVLAAELIARTIAAEPPGSTVSLADIGMMLRRLHLPRLLHGWRRDRVMWVFAQGASVVVLRLAARKLRDARKDASASR